MRAAERAVNRPRDDQHWRCAAHPDSAGAGLEGGLRAVRRQRGWWRHAGWQKSLAGAVSLSFRGRPFQRQLGAPRRHRRSQVMRSPPQRLAALLCYCAVVLLRRLPMVRGIGRGTEGRGTDCRRCAQPGAPARCACTLRCRHGATLAAVLDKAAAARAGTPHASPFAEHMRKHTISRRQCTCSSDDQQAQLLSRVNAAPRRSWRFASGARDSWGAHGGWTASTAAWAVSKP